MIEVDCAGQIFKTTQSTLTKCTYFQSVLDRWNETKEKIFVDCDPYIFNHFLNILRFPGYKIPLGDEPNLNIVCEYFGYIRTTDFVIIDCSGTLFEIEKSKMGGNSHSIFFVDEDPDIFRHVLNLLRNNDYYVPDPYVQNVYLLMEKYKFECPSQNGIIDCGGEIIRTKKDHILEIFGEHKNFVMIQEDPMIFRNVLNFVMDPNYIVPADMLEKFIICAGRYQIEYKIKSVKDYISSYGYIRDLDIKQLFSLKIIIDSCAPKRNYNYRFGLEINDVNFDKNDFDQWTTRHINETKNMVTFVCKSDCFKYTYNIISLRITTKDSNVTWKYKVEKVYKSI